MTVVPLGPWKLRPQSVIGQIEVRRERPDYFRERQHARPTRVAQERTDPRNDRASPPVLPEHAHQKSSRGNREREIRGLKGREEVDDLRRFAEGSLVGIPTRR